MGIADRHYMREPEDYRPGPASWSVTAKLMLVIAGAFFLQTLVSFHGPGNRLMELFALSLQGMGHGYIWQLLTFQFLHAGLLHLLFNLITIWFFGRPMEDALGGRAMLKLYLLSGVLGGLLQMLAALISHNHFGGIVVGASAGAFGMVAAFATLFPDRVLTLLLMFFIPISLRARTLLWISIALAVLGILAPTDNVAHAAHLGGIIFGVAFIRWRLMDHMNFRLPTIRRRRPRPMTRVVSGRRFSSRPRVIDAEEIPPEEFISQEVDPILDKISQHGIHSLTERERKILDRARERMAKR